MSKESVMPSGQRGVPAKALFATMPSLAETDSSSFNDDSHASNLPTFDVYPLSHLEGLTKQQQEQRFVKLHVIRHAEGTHNVNKEYRDLKHLDARLTPKGKEQCADRAQAGGYSEPQLIVTSPLTRCVETAHLSFPSLVDKVPVVAHESIRETVNYSCDRRRRRSEVAPEFPRVDFSLVQEHDEIWNGYEERLGSSHSGHRESGELHVVANRGRDFFSWLYGQEDKSEVILCSHAAFLRCIFGFGQKGGVLNAPPQSLDSREEPRQDVPVFRYRGSDDDFERNMRKDFSNCEMRSLVVAFPKELSK